MISSFLASPIPCRVCGDREPFFMAGLCIWCTDGGSQAPEIMGDAADLDFLDAVRSGAARGATPPRALAGRS